MSWKYLCAAALAGVLVPGMGATLARGQLVLTVNRTTGATTLANQTGAALALDNYAIRSNTDSLNPAGWSALATSGLAGAGWEKANPSISQLSELRLTGQFNFASNASLPLGNAVTALAQYDIDPNVSLEVIPLVGSAVPTQVNFTGARNNLVLTVNPYTGATTIKNESTSPAQLDNYSLRSPINGLSVTGWTSLTDAGQAGWEEANPTSAALNELRLTGATTLAPGASLNLGNAYIPGGYRDVSLGFTPVGYDEAKLGYVDYVGTPTPGSEIRLEDVSIADVSSAIRAPFDRSAQHMIDGSGLNVAAGSHAIGPDGNMWLSAGMGFGGPDDPSPSVTFDLGGVVDLTKMKIWNYNEDPAPAPDILLGRGVNQFEVSVGVVEGGPFTSLGTFTLDMAPGVGDVDFSETFNLDEDGVRFVKFDILSNHNGVSYPAVGGEIDAAFVGLSEVQFFGLATASGVPGDTNGDGNVDLNDLNNVRNNFGTAGPVGSTPGDAFPFDGNVDLDDLNGVRNNFGTISGGAAAVPEPGTLALALCMGIGALAFFRSRT